MKYLLFAAVLSMGAAHADEYDFMSLGNLGVGTLIRLNEGIILPANSEMVSVGSIEVLDQRTGNAVAYACVFEYEASPRLRQLTVGQSLEVTGLEEAEEGTTFNIGERLSLNCAKFMFSDVDRGIDLEEVSIDKLIESERPDSSAPLTVLEARTNVSALTFFPITPDEFFPIDDGEIDEEDEAPTASTESAQASDAAAAADAG